MPPPQASQVPMVSVVIPAYNHARFLEEAIESVLSQDYPGLELLVLDDGSPDDTHLITERYSESHPERFRTTRHENMGEVRTVNRGFELARGELLLRMSDDDALLPGAVSALVEVLVADPDAVVAYPAYETMNDDGVVIDTITPIEFSRAESLRLHECAVGPGAMFRRSVVERVGPWNPKFRYCPDWEFWLRAASLGRFRLLPRPLARYRVHREMTGWAGKSLEMAREHIELVDRVFSQDELEPEVREVEAEAYRNLYVSAAFCTGAGMNDPGERYYVADRLRERISEATETGDGEGAPADLVRHLRWLQDELDVRDRRIAQLEREQGLLLEYVRRPWWWHAARGAMPQRLRPWAKRTARRIRGGPAR